MSSMFRVGQQAAISNAVAGSKTPQDALTATITAAGGKSPSAPAAPAAPPALTPEGIVKAAQPGSGSSDKNFVRSMSQTLAGSYGSQKLGGS